MTTPNPRPCDALRRKLASAPALGPFCKTRDPLMVEAIGHGGMDFVVLDLEHGPLDIGDLGALIRAAECAGLAAVVRVGEATQISRALDLGAAGVQIPHVSGRAQAQAAVAAARFTPLGHRGVCRYVRAAASGTLERSTYFQQANASLVILQVEGAAGLAALPEILEVPGVDVIFVGVYDLSQSLGIIGQVDHPRVRAAVQQIAQQCVAKGMACGTFVESPQTARDYAKLGMHFLCYSVDVGLMAQACQSIRERFDVE